MIAALTCLMFSFRIIGYMESQAHDFTMGKRGNKEITIQYWTEEECRLAAERWINWRLEEFKQTGDTARLNTFTGVTLSLRKKYYNSREKVVLFEFEVKHGNYFIGSIEVKAERFVPSTWKIVTPQWGIVGSFVYDKGNWKSSHAAQSDTYLIRCLNELRKKLGEKAELEGPFFYYFTSPKCNPALVGYNSPKTKKLYLVEYATGRILPEDITLRSLQEDHDKQLEEDYYTLLEREKQIELHDEPAR